MASAVPPGVTRELQSHRRQETFGGGWPALGLGAALCMSLLSGIPAQAAVDELHLFAKPTFRGAVWRPKPQTKEALLLHWFKILRRQSGRIQGSGLNFVGRGRSELCDLSRVDGLTPRAALLIGGPQGEPFLHELFDDMAGAQQVAIHRNGIAAQLEGAAPKMLYVGSRVDGYDFLQVALAQGSENWRHVWDVGTQRYYDWLLEAGEPRSRQVLDQRAAGRCVAPAQQRSVALLQDILARLQAISVPLAATDTVKVLSVIPGEGGKRPAEPAEVPANPPQPIEITIGDVADFKRYNVVDGALVLQARPVRPF